MERCTKHRKYTGKKKPTHQCTICLNLYMALGGGQRRPIAPPSKVMRDKTKYNRKKKHRDLDTE